jgi:hypothetical protein
MTGPLLSRVQASNEAWFRKVDDAGRFRGVLHPVNPTQLPTSVFVLPRIALRVRLQEPVKSGELIRDRIQRVLLVGDHDVTLSASDPFSRVHALFQMTELVDWKRAVQTQNPITKQLETVSEPEILGPIWASIENFTRGDNDAGTRVTVDRLRAITAAPVVEGDYLYGRTVRRVQHTLGVYVSEIA